MTQFYALRDQRDVILTDDAVLDGGRELTGDEIGVPPLSSTGPGTKPGGKQIGPIRSGHGSWVPTSCTGWLSTTTEVPRVPRGTACSYSPRAK